eukprot:2149576-Alexandrium_andersonii.AAC.1
MSELASTKKAPSPANRDTETEIVRHRGTETQRHKDLTPMAIELFVGFRDKLGEFIGSDMKADPQKLVANAEAALKRFKSLEAVVKSTLKTAA